VPFSNLTAFGYMENRSAFVFSNLTVSFGKIPRSALIPSRKAIELLSVRTIRVDYGQTGSSSHQRRRFSRFKWHLNHCPSITSWFSLSKSFVFKHLLAFAHYEKS